MDARIFKGSSHVGSKTAAAGTVFTGLIPPKAQAYSKIARMVYTTAGTAHTLSVLKAQGRTTTTAAQIATDTSLTLSSISLAYDENGASLSENLAASDYVVVQHTDGTWGAYLMSGISGNTLTIGALAKAVASGAVVYGMYEVARTTGKASWQVTTRTSTTETFETYDPAVAVVSSSKVNEPLLIHSNNATAAGTLLYVSAVYTKI
jgi:hypothetical protein